MIRNFISLISLCLLVILTSADCGSTADLPLPSDEGNPHYLVLADEHLQQRHKVAILKALNDWATKTNYTLSYEIKYTDMSKIPRADFVEHTIRIYVDDPGPGYVGWTDWEADKQSAYVLVEPSVDGEYFRLVMLHELGHAFNLSFNGDAHYHGPYESVMYPSIGDSAGEVSCPELTAFCHNYGCQVDCINVEKPVPQPPAAATSIPIWKEPSSVIVH